MTRIGPSIVVDGELTASEPLQVDGHFRGNIVAREADLTLGPSAVVTADIRGVRVTVHGRLQGNITATERIELGASADVKGSLSANLIVIADGARFNGGIDMAERTIAAKVAEYRARS